jgi:hypothetical protein
MERRNAKQWINSLKIAIINNDLQKIEEYSNSNIPSFSSIEEAKEALNLVNQAKNILIKERNIISEKLQALKQNKQYFHIHNTSTMNFKA